MNKKTILNLVQIQRTKKDANGIVVKDDEGDLTEEIVFKVHTAKNTVDYEIGQILSKLQVHDLIVNTQIEINTKKEPE